MTTPRRAALITGASAGTCCAVLAADLTDITAPAAITGHAIRIGMPIDVLINNAGLSASAKFSQIPWESVAAASGECAAANLAQLDEMFAIQARRSAPLDRLRSAYQRAAA